jgi:hypothetical protein
MVTKIDQKGRFLANLEKGIISHGLSVLRAQLFKNMEVNDWANLITELATETIRSIGNKKRLRSPEK